MSCRRRSFCGKILGNKEVAVKLRTRISLSFIIIVAVPVILALAVVLGVIIIEAETIRVRYGINVGDLPADIRVLVVYVFICMVIILSITALILSLWISSGVLDPLTKLTTATKNIRDGNLDFEIKPEGVEEIRELCEAFEKMREELKVANEEKLEIDQQNRELISNISHDLRTPITAVKGYVEGIMDGVADTPDKMNRYIRTIYNKTNEMDRLINELSFYSKITTNRIPYNFNKVNVSSFYTDAADEIDSDLAAKNISFSYTNEVPGDVVVIADVEQIHRVISNIISNSIKYMDKPEKHISMKVMEVGDEIETEITDNGKGIEQKNLSSIFDRFYRTDSSRNSSQGGSGIGLSIVKKIVEDHGGRVWATSKLGEGTSMYFSLRKYIEIRQNADGTIDGLYEEIKEPEKPVKKTTNKKNINKTPRKTARK